MSAHIYNAYRFWYMCVSYLFNIFVWGCHTAVLGAYFRLCAQGLLLEWLGVIYGMLKNQSLVNCIQGKYLTHDTILFSKEIN